MASFGESPEENNDLLRSDPGQYRKLAKALKVPITELLDEREGITG
jgi:hypothetical protein